MSKFGSDENRDLAMMHSPLDWPRWPVLPLKRRKGQSYDHDDYCGFLFSDGKPTVYLHTIFGLGESKDGKGRKWSDVLAPLRKVEYDSLDELVTVWQVD